MKKLIFISVLASSLFCTTSFAKSSHYFVGQKEYLKKCRSCHRGSSVFVTKYTMKCWDGLMLKGGEKLINIHKSSNDPDLEEINKYFKSKRYKKKYKYIKAFVSRFASDGDKNPNHRISRYKVKCP